jgi:hypothetical protein
VGRGGVTCSFIRDAFISFGAGALTTGRSAPFFLLLFFFFFSLPSSSPSTSGSGSALSAFRPTLDSDEAAAAAAASSSRLAAASARRARASANRARFACPSCATHAGGQQQGSGRPWVERCSAGVMALPRSGRSSSPAPPSLSTPPPPSSASPARSAPLPPALCPSATATSRECESWLALPAGTLLPRPFRTG